MEELHNRWLSLLTQLDERQARLYVAGLVYNAVADLAAGLPGKWAGSEIRKLRRAWFNRPGQLYQTPEALIVYLDRFTGQQVWEPVVDDFNWGCHHIPWVEDRRLVIALTPRGHAGPDP